MNRIKAIFAVLFTAAAIMLMCVSAFASVTGRGSKEDPYLVSTYSELRTYCYKGGYVKLNNSIDYTWTRGETILISNETYLDLGGHVLTVDSTASSTVKMLFQVDGSFILDSKNGGTIRYINTDTSRESSFRCVSVSNNGSFIMNNGIINCTNSYGVDNNGYFELNYGFLTTDSSYYATAVNNRGTIVMNGGTLGSSESETYGIKELGTIYMNGGEIYGLLYSTAGSSTYIKGYISAGTIYKGLGGPTSADSGLTVSTFVKYNDNILSINGTERTADYVYRNYTFRIAGTVVFSRKNKTQVPRLQLINDVTPVVGKAPVLPEVPEGVDYKISSAKWTSAGTDNAVTTFEKDKTYFLTVNLVPKDSSCLMPQGLKYVSLSDTDMSYCTEHGVTETTDTSVSVRYTFKSKPDVYYITFNPNGGSGDMAEIEVDKNSEFTFPKCDFTEPKEDGYRVVFSNHWNDDETNIAHIVGSKMTINSNKTFSPIWTRTKLHTVSFNANGGTGTMPNRIIGHGEYLSDTTCKFSPPAGQSNDNWVFDGWYTNSACTIPFDETKPILGDITLYPKWVCYIREVRKQIALPNLGEAPAQPCDFVIGQNGETFIDHCNATGSWSPNDTEFQSGRSYTVTLNLQTQGSGEYRFSEDTKFYINQNPAKTVEMPNANTAVITYTFDPMYYEKLPFEKGSTGKTGTTLKLDKDEIDTICAQNDELLAAYFDGEYNFTWYADGKLIDGETGMGLYIKDEYEGKIISAKMHILGKSLPSDEIIVPKTIYKVSFNKGEGYGTMLSVQVENGNEYTLPENGFITPSGKIFEKWDKGYAGEKITVTGNVELTAQYCLLGDVDMNNKTDKEDARLYLNHIFGISEFNETQLYRADMNNDEMITLDDVELICGIYEVKFDTQGYSYNFCQPYILEGDPMNDDVEVPECEGMYFGGWFTDPECTEKYDFNTPVTSDFTLYARWEQELLLGDVNCDGIVSETDAKLYLKHLSGDPGSQFLSFQLERADVNKDGEKDMLDVIAILKIADQV